MPPEPKIRLLAPAKINFTLEVLGKRRDGYHDVRMLMAGVSLYDELSFSPWPECVLECNHPSLDCGSSNLILKAARLLQKKSGEAHGARIELKKKIPLGAGLAGGSTDAAAALLGLNRLWKLDMGLEELSRLGAQLGSDVPFCLESGFAIATGRGEKLKALSQKKKFHLLLMNPGFEVSTKWAYENVEKKGEHSRNLSRLVYEALDAKDFALVNKIAMNDLEAVTSREHLQIGQMRGWLSEAGALVTRMSGSGPTVWGLFENEASAKKAEKTLKDKAPYVAYVSTINAIPKAD